MNQETLNFISSQLEESAKLKLEIAQTHSQRIAQATDVIINSIENGGKLITAGNGGSAADAQHIAAELVVRFQKNRRALPAIALTADSVILTAAGNDFGYPDIFSRQLEALAKPEDVLLVISTSGNSANIIKAAQTAKTLEMSSIGLIGYQGGMLKDLVDLSIIIPSQNTPRIQEAHITIGHIICELIEKRFTI